MPMFLSLLILSDIPEIKVGNWNSTITLCNNFLSLCQHLLYINGCSTDEGVYMCATIISPCSTDPFIITLTFVVSYL